ncbi:hypothetical protein JCM19233_912 [Vibrio astriarenae]|nr:hypothetical protein JCM19233_912 [Vibrio sp. C7]
MHHNVFALGLEENQRPALSQNVSELATQVDAFPEALFMEASDYSQAKQS